MFLYVNSCEKIICIYMHMWLTMFVDSAAKYFDKHSFLSTTNTMFVVVPGAWPDYMRHTD